MGVKSKENLSEYEAKYRELRPGYEKLAEEIQFAIEKKLKAKDIKVAAVTYRAKVVEKFLEKIERKFYDNPLKEVTDLAGVRVVCLYESDLPKVKEIVRTEFKVNEEIDKREDLGTDKMGYQGKHFVVELGKGYSGARYNELQGLKCEIQVRTVLQDAWAIISHHLVYKNEDSVPEKFRRDLNNVAAMLEVAQMVFDNVRKKRDHYRDELKQKRKLKDSSAFLSQPVNYDTLEAYTKWKFPNLQISKQWHERMVADLNVTKYHSLQDIDDIVEAAAPAVEAYRQQRQDMFKAGTAFLTKSLGFVDKEFRVRHPFAEATLVAFEEFKDLVGAKPTKK